MRQKMAKSGQSGQEQMGNQANILGWSYQIKRDTDFSIQKGKFNYQI